MSLTFRWTIPPSTMATNIERYGERVMQAVAQVGQYLERILEDDARVSAPWTDRTGNARSGLTSTTDVAQWMVTVYLAHTVDYGVYLELSRGGKYAVIWSTIERHIPDIERLLRSVFR